VTESRPDDGSPEHEAGLSAARYRTLVDASDLAVWRADPDGALVTDMPDWRDLTGQQKDQLPGTGWLDAIPEPDRARVRETWERSVRTGELYDVEYPIVTSDGGRRLVHARGRPVRDGDRIVEWIGTAIDVTDRHDALAALEAATRQLALLASASHRLAASLDVDETAEILARACLPDLAESAVVLLLDAARDIQAAAVEHVDVERRDFLVELLDRYPVRYDAPYGSGAAIRTGEVSFVPSIDDEQRRSFAVDDEHFAMLGQVAPTSVISVPLAARGRVIGALSLRREGGVAYTEADVGLVQELAVRGALALDNALLYARERNAALMLQRSLLPRLLPEFHGVACAVRYRPGGAGAEVGGDWYDVLGLADGAIAVAVGDVQGRGLVAASVMGQLRAAVRAYTLEDHSPKEVMLRADAVLRSLDGGPLATCSYVRLDPVAGELVVAIAGHPPPLLADRTGTRFIDVDPGLPLGIGGAVFAQSTVPVEEGSVIVLYTDGLVEDARTALDAGMDRLAEVVGPAVAQGLDVEAIADHILERLVPSDDHDDDIALLVLAVGHAATDRTVDLADDPAAVRTARHLAEEVAASLGADESQAVALALLVSEVVTNAVRHTGSAGRLRIRLAGNRVRVEAFDGGVDVLRPRASTSAEPGLHDRRRGLQLLDSLADAWGVEPTSGGKCVWFELTAGAAGTFASPSTTEVPDGPAA
jgi:PAS domain S-box-containing protein